MCVYMCAERENESGEHGERGQRGRDRDERRGLRKINTGYVSEGVYTRAPRAQGNSYASGFQPLSLLQTDFVKIAKFQEEL